MIKKAVGLIGDREVAVNDRSAKLAKSELS